MLSVMKFHLYEIKKNLRLEMFLIKYIKTCLFFLTMLEQIKTTSYLSFRNWIKYKKLLNILNYILL